MPNHRTNIADSAVNLVAGNALRSCAMLLLPRTTISSPVSTDAREIRMTVAGAGDNFAE